RARPFCRFGGDAAPVWELLAETDNPLVVRALMDALLADSDASVRAAVADQLMDYRLDPVVQATLVAAAASDVSADVRLRARWSTLTREERSEYVSAALLDPDLTFEERMAPLQHARTHRRGMSNAEFNASEIPAVAGEALDAVAVIAASSRDAATRTTALVELGLGGHPEFVRHFMAERERRVRQSVAVNLA